MTHWKTNFLTGLAVVLPAVAAEWIRSRMTVTARNAPLAPTW